MYWHQGCANTGTISIQRAGAKVRIHNSKIIPQTYFPVFALMRIQAPPVFAQKLIPQECFPACIGFVPGGKLVTIVSRGCCCVFLELGGTQLPVAPDPSLPAETTSSLYKLGHTGMLMF